MVSNTDVSRQDEEVVVGQSTILVRVKEALDIKPVARFVVGLEDLQCLGVVQDLSFVADGSAI